MGQQDQYKRIWKLFRAGHRIEEIARIVGIGSRSEKQVGCRVIVLAEAVSPLLLRVLEIGGELPAQFFLACHLAEHHLGD